MEKLIKEVIIMKKTMFLLSFALLLSFASTTAAEGLPQVELFDVEVNDVVKKRTPNEQIQKEATSILQSINGIYVKINPMPKDGYMVRIPLAPSLTVKNKWFNDFINEMVLIIPEEEEPYIMLLDDENHPHFLIAQRDFYQIVTLILGE